jgi:hypothetical protein
MKEKRRTITCTNFATNDVKKENTGNTQEKVSWMEMENSHSTFEEVHLRGVGVRGIRNQPSSREAENLTFPVCMMKKKKWHVKSR